MILRTRSRLWILVIVTIAFGLILFGCSKKEGGESTSDKIVIQNQGSDTMVNLAQAWAEEYAMINPGVSVEVSGGGSGTGIAALINGTVDIANTSRKMKPAEIVDIIKASGLRGRGGGGMAAPGGRRDHGLRGNRPRRCPLV